MALNTAATLQADAVLAGWTEPKDYKPGTFKPRDGGDAVDFGSGTSFRVCVVHGDHDFTVLKVRGRHNKPEELSNLNRLHGAMRNLSLGETVRIEYTSRDGNFELLNISALQPAGK